MQCAAIAIEFAEIAQDNDHYTVQGHSRSLKVTDFGTNRKLIYDFLLVVILTYLLSGTVSEI